MIPVYNTKQHTRHFCTCKITGSECNRKLMVHLSSPGLRSAPKNGAKCLLNGNGDALNTLFWWRKCCNYGSWEGHSLCSFWRIFGAWLKSVYNTCLILQNTLDVTVTALASRIKENIPIERRDLWKRWFLILWSKICLALQDEKTNISDEG